LDLATGTNYGNQTQVIMWNKDGSNGQKWNVEGSQLKGIGGKCLDAGDNRRGSWLRINDCHGGSNQSWTFYNNYTIKNNGSGLCLGLGQSGSGSLSLGNGMPLIMVNCNRDNCSTYFSSDALGGYNISTVDPQCVRDVGLTPVTPPPAPTPSPQNPNPQPYYNPVGNGGNSGNSNPPPIVNPPGGTQTPQNIPDTPDPRDVQPGTTVDPNTYRGQSYPAVISEDSELTLSLATQIAKEGYQQFQTEIMSGISSCPISGPSCLANSSYRSAMNNAIYSIYRLLVGIFKGLGRLFMDFITFFWQFGEDLARYGLGAFWLLLFSVGSTVYNAKAIIKSWIPTNKSVYEYRNMNYYDKMEHHGYHIAYIGGTIFAAVKTVAEISQTAIGVAGAIKTATLNNGNIAKLMKKLEIKPGLIVRETPVGEPIFKGVELATQTIDDVGKVAPSAKPNMIKLHAIEDTRPSGIVDIGHINSRHAFEATFADPTVKPSKFLQGADYKALANEALSKTPISRTGGTSKFPDGFEFDSIKIEVDMGRQIGTNFVKSTPKNKLRIIMDYYGNIVTIIPF
jgi:hypothetical protein